MLRHVFGTRRNGRTIGVDDAAGLLHATFDEEEATDNRQAEAADLLHDEPTPRSCGAFLMKRS